MHRFPPRLWLQRHRLAADSLLAGILTFLAVGAHWNAPLPAHGHPPNAIGTVLVCLTALPLALRRRAPIAVLVAVSIPQFAVDAIGFPNFGWLGLMIALYTMAAHTGGPERTIAAEVFAVSALTLLIVGLALRRIDLGDFVSAIVFLVGAFVLGDNIQRRRVNVAELATRAEHAERERELIAQQRAQEERSRIARELHDVVAHSVSLMIIQAGAARRSIANSPAQAEETLRTLESTGRQAMDELRRVLGVLRTQSPDRGELSPQPSLRDVRELVTGDPTLPIELTEVGDAPGDVPPSVGLSLYRVVQEALTNVRKHAGQVRTVAVKLSYSPDRVEVLVADDGRGASVALNQDGHGLVGMRERMALCGGTVTAGPRQGGGWQVRASAPLSTLDQPVGGSPPADAPALGVPA
ncbi:MAG: putative two-component histidine kinase [Acidimicrobiales bacterium]|nr:putative two-component histidine kinase [Acidimicrobiales bacterium]